MSDETTQFESFTPSVGLNHFGFSGIGVDELESTQYTLVTVVVDETGSVYDFQSEMETCIGSIVESCRSSAFADTLLLRVVAFNRSTREVHGFKPLMDCNPGDYVNALKCGGATALYDASVDGIESLTAYGRTLTDQDYDVNGIVVVITDGGNNVSGLSVKQVNAALSNVVASENLESLMSILIGVNADQYDSILQKFQADAGFSQYVNAGNADAKTLAKVAGFISKSITSQSQALGTGGPSKTLVF